MGQLGKNLHVSFDGTDLTDAFMTSSKQVSATLVDQTAGSDSVRTFLLDTVGGTVSLAFQYAAAEYAACDEGTEGDLVMGFSGNGSGSARETVNAFVESRNIDSPRGGVQMVNVTFRLSGAVTSDTYP